MPTGKRQKTSNATLKSLEKVVIKGKPEEPRKWRFTMYFFDPKTHEIQTRGTWTTQRMLKAQAQKCVDREIADSKSKNLCYELYAL